MYKDAKRWALTFQSYVQLTMLQQHSKKQVGPHDHYNTQTSHRSSTDKNSGGPMKTLIVVVLQSGKKILVGNPSVENQMFNKLGPVKLLKGQ